MTEAIIGNLALELAKGAAESVYGCFEQKVTLITQFTKDLRKFREAIVELSTFVKDASSKYDGQPDPMKQWTVKLYQTFLDAQLVLDLFQAHQDHPPFSLFGFHVQFGNQMGRIIQDIQSSVKEHGKVGMLGLVRGLGDPQQTPNYENPRIEGSTLRAEDTSVDLDYRVASVGRMLDKGRVVAAVGMGGIGKTRLLQHIFMELRRVDLSEAESKQFLSVYHKLRRVGLIEHDNSKIRISTREETVANSFNAQIYRVESSCFSSEDQSTVKKILQKCGGLSLAILAMTGVLANQRTRHWHSTLQELQVLSSNSSATSHIMNILGLSYKALPYQLKRCFASLSICVPVGNVCYRDMESARASE